MLHEIDKFSTIEVEDFNQWLESYKKKFHLEVLFGGDMDINEAK